MLVLAKPEMGNSLINSFTKPVSSTSTLVRHAQQGQGRALITFDFDGTCAEYGFAVETMYIEPRPNERVPLELSKGI
ncbi:hypothetical protein VNO77_24451 [Canavalia gladiata]|uniref:Uncharacterized protein n=1 Tax=Canavalia gladiata TaxID=3824 RepID=A0AAN9L8T9_CANGL